ncbi:MAG: cobyrinate a,c-diamide synthase [Verrucomicrobiae bacterium]|nr:cobyrinate a,c-diamide synthase [Verrucomicrobiae bacterium]
MKSDAMNFSAFCLAGTQSGVGKTTLALGLLAALRKRGLRVQPFKCGPDYLDAGHHRRASGAASRNLDPWMMGEDGVDLSYRRASAHADISVVEGVMGLFDGASPADITGSTAHVAKLLALPVILVVNGRGMARSIAAMVGGYARFETGVNIIGVIANRVGSERHANLLSESLAAARLPPLLGWLPGDKQWEIPERHLGLMADTETQQSDAWYDSLAEAVTQRMDLNRLLSLTRQPRPVPPPGSTITPAAKIRLGIALDEAFHFYYEDNLDLLREQGIELVPFSPLKDTSLPEHLDGLYLGGGFPELFAEQLEANASLRESVRAYAASGGPIYAECGGLMFLGQKLIDLKKRSFAMCGALPIETAMQDRLQRLGYVTAATLAPGPLGPTGAVLRGHEFHWSTITRSDPSLAPCYKLRYNRDHREETAGLRLNNIWASYIHLHFYSNLWRHLTDR